MHARILPLILAVTLTACAGDGKTKKSAVDIDPRETAESLYTAGKTDLDKGNYETAIESYGKLESRYPFGPYAQQAQLDTAFAHYKLDEPDAAIAAADQFIKLQPQHANVDYAYYIKGLANFQRNASFLDRVFGKRLSDVDVTPLRQSFIDFKLLLQRFPNSIYADDARQRMIYLRNQLALHEYEIARFYARKRADVAVVQRLTSLIEQYDGADIIPRALVLLATTYDRLKLADAYNETLRVLEHNFPDQAGKVRRN
ncbi:MAG: outer membrane protein assembly factor BamD [Thiotrichales bacterium]